MSKNKTNGQQNGQGRDYTVVDEMLKKFDSLSLEEHERIWQRAGIFNEQGELTRDYGGQGDPPKAQPKVSAKP